MPLITPGQERKSGRRWVWVTLAVLLGAPIMLTVSLYAYLRWGPVPSGDWWDIGPYGITLDGEEPNSADYISDPAVDYYGGITTELRGLHIGKRFYTVRIRR